MSDKDSINHPDMLWRQHARTSPELTQRNLVKRAGEENRQDRLEFLFKLNPKLKTDTALTETYADAAHRGYIDLMRWLDTIDPASPKRLSNAFLRACNAGHIGSLKFLLSRGVDANVKNGKGLVEALHGDKGDAVDFLLRHGARMQDTEREFADTPPLLFRALRQQRLNVAKALLLHGADPFARHDRETPRDICRRQGMEKLGDLIDRLHVKAPLVSADDIKAQDWQNLQLPQDKYNGLTGMQVAAYNGHIDILVEKMAGLGRSITKSDLITATPRYPQTLLFILGQRGELDKIFGNLALWGKHMDRWLDAETYIPAAFRKKTDAARLKAAFARTQMIEKKKRGGVKINFKPK